MGVGAEPKTAYLLFYDTFTHNEHTEEHQLDMISFNNSVIIHEIRVVPNGVAGHPLAPMKGETFPDNFELDFYAKVAKKKNACVFEPMGHLSYDKSSIQLICDHRIGMIDSIVLYGSFVSCTLAVYGTPFDEELDRFNNKGPTSPLPIKNQQLSPMDDESSLSSLSDAPDEQEAKEEDKSDIDVDDIELDAKIEEARKALQERNKVESLYECLSPEGSPVADRGGKDGGKGDYEELSDEELPEGEAADDPMGEEGEEEEVPSWMFVSVGYDPYSFRAVALEHLTCPTATFYQKNVRRMKKKNPDSRRDVREPKNVRVLTDLIKAHGSNPEVTPKWILALEQCYGLVSNFLHYLSEEDTKSVTRLLGKWVLSALSISALSALPPGLNVRGLKAGLQLMSALCCCSPAIVDSLLRDNVIHKLLKLLAETQLGTPIKLLALQAIGATLISEKAVKEFHKMTLVGVGKTGYQVLTEQLLDKQTDRVSYACTVILARVHLYELLSSIKYCAQKCVKHSNDNDKESSKQLTAEFQSLSAGIRSLVDQYLNRPHVLAMLPQKSYPQAIPSPESTQSGFIYLLSMMEAMLTVESVAMVTSVPLIRQNVDMAPHLQFTGLTPHHQELIVRILSSYNGTVFLASRHEASNILIRCLLENSVPAFSVMEIPSLIQIRHSDITLNSNTLGLLLTLHLHAVQLLDQILIVAVKEPFSDDIALISALSFVSALLMVPAGRSAYFTLVSEENNMTALLTFLAVQPDKGLEKMRKKSLAYRHALQDLQCFVRSGESVKGIIRNLTGFTNLCTKSDKDETLSVAMEWLHPYATMKMMCTKIDAVINYIKTNTETLESEANLPRLTTALRLIEHLTSQHSVLPHSVALELTSASAMDALIGLFDKTCKMLQKPWLQGVLCGDIVVAVVDMITPALNLNLNYLQHLSNTKHPYTNMNLITPLLQLHTLLFSLPPPSAISNTMTTLQHSIASILLTYTAGIQSVESKWTNLVEVMVKYCCSNPQSFISSMMLLCELLPHPLPLVTSAEIGPEEQTLLLHYRETWSAHLLPFWEKILSHVESLLPSCNNHVHQVLRRLLAQICDLSVQFSVQIVALLFKEWETHPSALQNLSFLAYEGSSKAAIMDFLIADRESFSKLLSSTTEETKDQQALLCLHGLCDPFVNMLDYNPTLPGIPQSLVNSLLPSDMLQEVPQHLLATLNEGDYTSVSLRLRILWLLADNKIGQAALRLGIHGGEYKAILERLCQDTSLTQQHDQCCSLLLDVLHRLISQGSGELRGMADLLLGAEGLDSLNQLKTLLGQGHDLTSDIAEIVEKLENTVSEEVPAEVCVAPVRGSGRGQWDSRRVAVQQPHSEYWQPASMDSEGTGEQVRVDLEELCKASLPNLALKETLENQLSLGGVKYAKEFKGQRGLGEGEHINARDMAKRAPTYESRARPQRSMMRLAAGHDLVRDVFRSRKQNTSRPPSMHVDDFIAMEKHKAGPTLPPTNQIPMLQERYSNADLHQPSPLALWGGRVQYNTPRPQAPYQRPLPETQGAWYQGAAQSTPSRYMDQAKGGNPWHRERGRGGGRFPHRNFDRQRYDNRF